MFQVIKYDEDFLFNIMNKTRIKKIRLDFQATLSKEDVKVLCEIAYNKIRSLQTQNILSNDVC